ncbi:MAG: pseudaminic acid synthase [Puniceicoccales bacterium]|jgi:N-acetylneuraminate synthase|nr:pseudaminic acid synthase [Puniceicoccales bacterium]
MIKKRTCFNISGRPIGPQHEPYFVAELSSNHQQCIEHARGLIKHAKDSGADAVKLQTYTADTLTLPIRNDQFKIDGPGRIQYLYDLYQLNCIPWAWHEDLADYAKKLNIALFSTPFDETSVDFLEKTIHPPVYKISSSEITHLPLLKKVASTEKPVILSTGLAKSEEIEEAIETLRNHGCTQWILLKCIFPYAAGQLGLNLRAISKLQKRYACPIGISDHFLSYNMVLGSVALGACLVEKHLILTRQDDAMDSKISLEPEEFRSMVRAAKELYKELGEAVIGPISPENDPYHFKYRRSIYVCKRIEKGEIFSTENLKIVRPALGLAPKHWEQVLGKQAKRDLEMGTPLSAADIVT